MDVRRRSSMKAPLQNIQIPSLAAAVAMRSPMAARGSPLPAMGSPMAGVMKPHKKTVDDQIDADFTKASDALPLPLYVTNAVFFTLFFSVVYYLLSRWREKIRNSTPLHIVTISEIAAIVAFFASFVYLLGFFGVGFVQFFSPRSSHDDVWGVDDEEEDVNQALLKEDTRAAPCAAAYVPSPKPKKIEIIDPISSEEDEEIGNHSILLPRIQARRHQTRRRHPPRGVTEGDRKVSPL